MTLQLPRPLKSLMALFVFGFLWMAAPVSMAAPPTRLQGGSCAMTMLPMIMLP
ncbi:MAG: hypothetical protein H7A03_07205 [Pseudomonadales bacterium]|nr:hypothetical protein [Pseudomonadales bacterium]